MKCAKTKHHMLLAMFSSLLLLLIVSLVLEGNLVHARNLLHSSRPSPRVEAFRTSDPKQTLVEYHDHPFDRQRKLEEEYDPTQKMLNYDDRDSFETLRIKFITDPIEVSPNYYSSGFDQVLPEILDIVSQTWSSYLSVYPVSGNIPISKEDCFGFLAPNISDLLEANGVTDADMAILVGGESTIVEDGQEVDVCGSGGALAFAFTCSIDTFDRPVIGAINFCVNNIQAQIEEVDQNRQEPIDLSMVLEGNDAKADIALVAIHEVGHALGFSLNLFKFFRDEYGTPLTPRPFTPTDVSCVDGTVKNLIFPSTNTVATRQTSDGRIYHEIVTPRVTQVARNHFNCQSMTGARLENQPTGEGGNCTGSHWDERLFLSELMGPIFSGYSDILSPLTLALLEDSGWYKVTYENAPLSPYGKGRGCDFVNEPCIVNDQIPEYGNDVFCNTVSYFVDDSIGADVLQCDPTHKSYAVCDLFDISAMPDDFLAIIPDDRVQLFSDPNLVSISTRADFCPLPLIDAGLDCTNEEGNAGLQIYRGESRGLSSRCINGQFGTNIVPGCFEIECNAPLHKVIINGQVCNFDGQQLSVRTVDFVSATLTCPALATICPNLFCPGECSGRGVCNYDSTPPRCECFDTSDTSAACSLGLPSQPGTEPTSSTPVPEPSPSITLPPSLVPSSDGPRQHCPAALSVLLTASAILFLCYI